MKKIFSIALSFCLASFAFAEELEPYEGFLTDPNASWIRPSKSAIPTNVIRLSKQDGGISPSDLGMRKRKRMMLKAAPLKTSVSTRTVVPLQLTSNLPLSDNGRIKELVRGLDYDWKKCYKFVRDNIAFSLYPGLMRGPERTLVDREGNDLDQAMLLVSMLRESGYVNSTVVGEDAAVVSNRIACGWSVDVCNHDGKTPYNAASWLGLPDDGPIEETADIVAEIFAQAFMPIRIWLGDTKFVTNRYFVQLEVDGETIYLDPAFKPTAGEKIGGDIKKDSGYDRDSLLAAAGGTVGNSCVKNLSESGIASEMNRLYQSMKEKWNDPNKTAGSYMGLRKIVPCAETDPYMQGRLFSEAPYDFLAQDDAIKNYYRVGMILACDGWIVQRFFLDEVGVRNVWFTSFGDEEMTFSTLYIDDVELSSKCWETESPYFMDFIVDVDHWQWSAHSYGIKKGEDNTFVLTISFDGFAKDGMRAWAAKEMARLDAMGSSVNKHRRDSAALLLGGQNWMEQTHMAMRARDAFSGNYTRNFYKMGIAGQDGGPYVDMANGASYEVKWSRTLDPDMLFSSALEHSVWEQLNGTEVPAVSTIRAMELANQSGSAIYYMTSNNCDHVLQNLVGYSEYKKEDLRNSVMNGSVALLPQNGQLKLHDWTGVGYIVHSAYGAGMIISGGMNGGQTAIKSEPQSKNWWDKAVDKGKEIWNWGVEKVQQVDPVSMPDGSYMDQRTDLALNRKNPLTWTRTYTSGGNYDIGTLGRGWTHNFEASVRKTTNPEAVFGSESTAAHAALPTALAMVVVDDLLADEYELDETENARRQALASMVVMWWTHQLNDATVLVKTGHQSLSFQKAPDGTFIAPPNVTASLSYEDYQYKLQELHGNTYEFNYNDRLGKIIDPSGNATTLYYFSNWLMRVESPFDAAFDFEWDFSKNKITKVTDSAGRSVSYSYDENGCLMSCTDVRGKIWRMDYDENSYKLLSQYDPLNRRTVENTYNQLGQVIKQVSALGGVSTLGYAEGFEAWDEDPLGYRLTHTYDKEGRSVSCTDRTGAKSYTIYDALGHAVTNIDAMGIVSENIFSGNRLVKTVRGTNVNTQVTCFGYDARDRMIAITNAIGGVVTMEYDESDRVVKTTNLDGSYVQRTWDDKGLMTREETFSQGGESLSHSVFEYNGYGLQTSRTLFGLNLPNDGIKEELSYADDGNVSTTKNANGHVDSYEYDISGRLVRTTDALGRNTARTYDDCGYLQTVTDLKGRTNRYLVNADGLILATYFYDGSVVSNVYDLAGRLASQKDVHGCVTRFDRDGNGGIVRSRRIIDGGVELDALGYVYDPLCRCVCTSNAMGVASYSDYDELSRLVRSSNTSGATWATGYDVVDRPIVAVDPLGRESRATYDAMNRKLTSVRPSGAVDSYAYDKFGHMSKYTNAEGNSYKLSYDALGRVLSTTNANQTEMSQSVYDKVGNLVQARDANGSEFRFEYDEGERLIRKTGPDKTTVYSYDLADNLISASDGQTSLLFEYDVDDNMKSVSLDIDSKQFRIGWGYDVGGLLTNTVYDVGKSVTRSYRKDGRLEFVRDWLGHEWRYSYDKAGRLVGVVSPDNKATEFAYDVNGRLSRWHVKGVAGRDIQYDPAGRRIKDVVIEGDMPRHTANRVANNRFDPADRIVSDEGDARSTFTYDQNGSLLSQASLGKTQLSMTYQKDGAISRIESDILENDFKYDALGNRVVVSGEFWIPDYQDAFKRPLIECDSSGAPVRYYIWAGAELLGYIDSSGVLTVAHCDDFANVVALTADDGALKFLANYGPNGEAQGASGVNETPFGWLGGFGVKKLSVRMNGMPLYITHHRLYSSAYKRFLSTDPLGLSGGYNLYAYANGNPLLYIDPLGDCAKVKDWYEENHIGTRIDGLFQMMGGGAEIAAGGGMVTAGVAASGTGAGAVVGVPTAVAGVCVVAHGTDQFVSGFVKFVSGEDHQTATSKMIQDGYGVDRQTADNVNNVVTIGFTLGAGSVTSAGSTVARSSAGNATQQAETKLLNTPSKANGNMSNPLKARPKNDGVTAPKPGPGTGNPGQNPFPGRQNPQPGPKPTPPPQQPQTVPIGPMRRPPPGPGQGERIDIDALTYI